MPIFNKENLTPHKIEEDKNEEFKRGYNQCLKDLKLTGERHQNLYL